MPALLLPQPEPSDCVCASCQQSHSRVWYIGFGIVLVSGSGKQKAFTRGCATPHARRQHGLRPQRVVEHSERKDTSRVAALETGVFEAVRRSLLQQSPQKKKKSLPPAQMRPVFLASQHLGWTKDGP